MHVLLAALPLSYRIPITGVIRVPEWKDGSDNTRHEQTLAAVACTPWLGAWDSRDTVLTRLLLRHLPLYLFNSFFSSLRKRQSVPCAMSFCGLLVIIPASCRRRA